MSVNKSGVKTGSNRWSRIIVFVQAMLDQGAQSLVNLVVGVVAARALSASDFGAFSIAFLLFTVAWGSYRALLVEPAIVLFREAPVTQVLDAKAGMIVLSLMLTAPLCACLLYTSPSPRDATLSRMPSSA